MIKRIAIWAAVLAMAWAAGQAGASTIYWVTTGLAGGGPVISNPQVTLNLGESKTLYLWADIPVTAQCLAMGLDFVETNSPVITATAVTVANPLIGADPEEPGSGQYRWGGTSTKLSPVAGFSAAGGLGLRVDLTDPTLAPPPRPPYRLLLGSFTFTGAALGSTDIFLTVNGMLMTGNASMIGSIAGPVLHFGAGDAAIYPNEDPPGIFYMAYGAQSAVADATITVVPEPAGAGLVVVGAMGLVRRRGLSS